MVRRPGLRELKTKVAPFYSMSRTYKRRRINFLFTRLVPYGDEETQIKLNNMKKCSSQRGFQIRKVKPHPGQSQQCKLT